MLGLQKTNTCWLVGSCEVFSLSCFPENSGTLELFPPWPQPQKEQHEQRRKKEKTLSLLTTATCNFHLEILGRGSAFFLLLDELLASENIQFDIGA